MLHLQTDHIWVYWMYKVSSHQCNPDQEVIVNVDGDEKTSHLASEDQIAAYAKADPCLNHVVKLKAYRQSLESVETNYNLNRYLGGSGFLLASLSERMCLNKDKTTVNIMEPIEPFRPCIITRGKQNQGSWRCDNFVR